MACRFIPWFLHRSSTTRRLLRRWTRHLPLKCCSVACRLLVSLLCFELTMRRRCGGSRQTPHQKQRLLGGPTTLPQIAAFGDFYDQRTTAGILLLRETLGRQHSTQTRVISDAAEHLPPYKSDLKRFSETNATASMLETAPREYRASGHVDGHRRVARVTREAVCHTSYP